MSVHKTSADHDSRYYTETEIDEKIDKLNNDIANKSEIKKGIITATPDEGTLSTSLFVNDIIILSAYTTAEYSYIVIPFGANNHYWYFRILHNTALAGISSEVTVVYYYIEI